MAFYLKPMAFLLKTNCNKSKVKYSKKAITFNLIRFNLYKKQKMFSKFDLVHSQTKLIDEGISKSSFD